MSEPISERLDELATATVALTKQVTILSEAVVDLRRLREQQQDLYEQQVATDQRARLGMVHALDASDQVHTVDERVQRLASENQLALRRTSRGVRATLMVVAVLLGAYVAVQFDYRIDNNCPRPYTASPLSKAACALALPGEPGSQPPNANDLDNLETP